MFSTCAVNVETVKYVAETDMGSVSSGWITGDIAVTDT